MQRSKRWKIERDPGFCLKVGNGRGKKNGNKHDINGHCGQRKGLRNQLGHTELQEYNTGPNKGSTRNFWREEYRMKDS